MPAKVLRRGKPTSRSKSIILVLHRGQRITGSRSGAEEMSARGLWSAAGRHFQEEKRSSCSASLLKIPGVDLEEKEDPEVEEKKDTVALDDASINIKKAEELADQGSEATRRLAGNSASRLAAPCSHFQEF